MRVLTARRSLASTVVYRPKLSGAEAKALPSPLIAIIGYNSGGLWLVVVERSRKSTYT